MVQAYSLSKTEQDGGHFIWFLYGCQPRTFYLYIIKKKTQLRPAILKFCIQIVRTMNRTSSTIQIPNMYGIQAPTRNNGEEIGICFSNVNLICLFRFGQLFMILNHSKQEVCLQKHFIGERAFMSTYIDRVPYFHQ